MERYGITWVGDDVSDDDICYTSLKSVNELRKPLHDNVLSGDGSEVANEDGDDRGSGNEENVGHLQDPSQMIKSIKMIFSDNIVVAQININSIRNKGNVDILVITETKLDNTFPISQFKMDGYATPYRLDRNRNGRGILVFVREDIPSKNLQEHMLPGDIEALPIEINLRKTKLLILAAYHPPFQSDEYFFANITKTLDKYVHSYEKVLLAGDFNAQENETIIK